MPREKLVQLTLDLGQPINTSCRQCGMNYHPSDPSDVTVHKRFHAKSVGGVDVSSTLRLSRVVWRAGNGNDYIAVVDRRSSAAEKRKTKEVLELVESELSAAEIPDKDLWTSTDRYRFYLYIVLRVGGAGKCVGLLLTERIDTGYPVVDSRFRNGVGSSANVVLELENKRKAVMGVSRVWTCLTNRGNGVARTLLDTACETFVYGMTVRKELVAFSQPTESGERLARSWFSGSRVAVTRGDISTAEGNGGEKAPSPSAPPLPSASPQPGNLSKQQESTVSWLVYVG